MRPKRRKPQSGDVFSRPLTLEGSKRRVQGFGKTLGDVFSVVRKPSVSGLGRLSKAETARFRDITRDPAAFNISSRTRRASLATWRARKANTKRRAK